MTNVKDLVLTEIVDAVFFDTLTGDLWFSLDELQNWTLNQAEESTNVTGRRGRLITTIKKNKTITLSGTNGLVSAGLLEAQTGNKFSKGTTTVQWTDYLKVSSNAATTAYKAVGTAGSEIMALYVKADDETIGTELEQVASGTTLTTGKFTYDPSTKALAFYSGDIADGKEIVVIYMRQLSGSVLKVDNGTVSGDAIAYVNALAEDVCHNVYRVQFYFPNIAFSGAFSLATGGDQTTHGFEATAEADGCAVGGAELFTYTVFGANAADVVSA